MSTRTQRINLVVSDKEMRIIKEKAEKEEMSLSEYIRFMAIYNGGKQS